MALLDKLFATKRKLYAPRSRDRRSPKISPEQVRLLLFKECDWRGRKLLFDSSTIERTTAGKHDKPTLKPTCDSPHIVEISNGFAYVYKGPATDACALGEMIFGAVALNYKGVSLKIHIMDEPKRLMCTKLFTVPTSRRVGRRPGSDVERPASGSRPLSVPTRDELALSFSTERADSGFYGEHSLHSSVSSTCDFFSMFDIWDGNASQEDFYTFHSPSGRKLSTSSNGSWQRRTFRNLATRFDLGSQNSNLLNVPTAGSNVTSCDSQIYSNSSTSGTSDSLTSGASGGAAPQRKNKLGLALLITVADTDEIDLVRRCMEHSAQLQSLVCRLRMATLAAGGAAGFVHTLHAASLDAARWLTDLLYGERLQPMWLSVATGDRGCDRTVDTLLATLCAVLAAGDTKHTNFFVSTLLTHVLTHHLGWVTTVSPYDVLDPQQMQPLDETPARPYNALWAQLSDLCGSIGFPPKAARTIISGATNAQFVKKLLLVLTYFVRCGEVKRNTFQFKKDPCEMIKVINVERTTPKRTPTRKVPSRDTLKVPSFNTRKSNSSDTLTSEVSVKRTATLANLSEMLSTEQPMTSRLRCSPVALSSKSDSSSSLNSTESEPEQNVVFVLGDDERLVGLKNKSTDGKSVKKSVRLAEAVNLHVQEGAPRAAACHVKCARSAGSPPPCCAMLSQHYKSVRHSGFKFEFDKYPQIVTNYMKSKNLEILDRHYIGKPGNLKLDNFQFDPTIVPPIQEERCEACYQCQLIESTLQTPTNASELEFMNDMPRHAELASAVVTQQSDESPVVSPKIFTRVFKSDTVLVNVITPQEPPSAPAMTEAKVTITGAKETATGAKDTAAGANDTETGAKDTATGAKDAETAAKVEKKDRVKQVLEFPVFSMGSPGGSVHSGFDASLLGGVTDHYVPDLILQGTLAKPEKWESELRRDIELTSYLNKSLEAPIQAVAIIGDTNTWEVRVVGRDGPAAGGMSALVGSMLDALPHMWRAKVPAHQCILFLESKLREFCVLSKSLADMLMSRDFCDIASLSAALEVDMNDVPLLLAVATTHTPQVARRYGISYR